MEWSDDPPLSLCFPLPKNPMSSPNSKKACARERWGIQCSHTECYPTLNEQVHISRTKDKPKHWRDCGYQRNIEGIEHIAKTNNDKMHAMSRQLSEQDEKIEAERYSWRWNLKLFNLTESTYESTEELWKQIFQILDKLLQMKKTSLVFSLTRFTELDAPEMTGALVLWESNSQDEGCEKYGKLRAEIWLRAKNMENFDDHHRDEGEKPSTSRGSDIWGKTMSEETLATCQESPQRWKKDCMAWSRCDHRRVENHRWLSERCHLRHP